MEPVVHPPGAGETHATGISQVVIKANSDDTGGKLFLAETTIAPGFLGPPPHYHETLHDMFYVLDGTLTMRLGDEELLAEAGTFVCVPPGTVHAFSNPGDAPVRFLNFSSPGGFERYMRDLAAAAAERPGEPLTPERIGAVASNYDIKVA